MMPTAYSPREMLARLVAFPTVSTRSNLDLVGFVESYLADHGVASFRDRDTSGDKASLVAMVGPVVEGGVVLSGHSDVVPVDGQTWSGDPFALTARHGRLYGRGACDMKGFLACALAAVPAMRAAPLRRPIVLAISRDEEIGCIGAPPMIEAMLARLPRPAAVVIGEPSEMRVVTGQKGSWGFRALVRGHAVHSSLLPYGVSAVMEAARFIDWLTRQMEHRAATTPPNAFDPPFTTIHVGMIAGGSANNITARECRFSGELRCLPEESVAGWRDRILAEAGHRSAAMQAIHPDTGIGVETRMELPGFLAEGPAEGLARSLTGDRGSSVVSYQTEAGYFQGRGLSTVICGPGSIAQAHKPDEFLSEEQLAAGSAFVDRLIQHLAA
jgi:acetylornithine deacetylase